MTKCTIIGAGKSGVSAALLAKRKGYRPFVTEAGAAAVFADAASELAQAGIETEFGGHTSEALADAELLITSPGVPPSAALFAEAQRRGIPIIGELEFAARWVTQPIIAVTGTNGKTTTTSLIAWILAEAGIPAQTAGNIGRPLSALVDEIPEPSWVVVEASSYQLDRIDSFQPRIAAILNITPDHLEYHGGMEHYVAAKYAITARQTAADALILNIDDSYIHSNMPETQARLYAISSRPVEQGAYFDSTSLLLSTDTDVLPEGFPLSAIALPGPHNRYNVMAAALAARLAGASLDAIRRGAESFPGVEHRLEAVRTIGDIRFINDSKATNIDAARFALLSFDAPIVWIAGGQGDDNDYAKLDDLVRRKTPYIVALGAEAAAICAHFDGIAECSRAESLAEAVQMAYAKAPKDAVALFAPACKSFDMFRNFEERGREFKRCVHALKP